MMQNCTRTFVDVLGGYARDAFMLMMFLKIYADPKISPNMLFQFRVMHI